MHLTPRRIIEFSRKEILDAAANTADRYTVGVGKIPSPPFTAALKITTM